MNSPGGNFNWLITGLGNPGPEYEKTRHNLGFMVIDQIARELNTSVKRKECRSLIGQTRFNGETIEMVKPLTFMNLSGEAVSCFLKKEKLPVLIIVACLKIHQWVMY